MNIMNTDIGLILFVIGFLGFLINHKNYLMALISIEVILLSCTYNFILFSHNYNDIVGPCYSLIILSIAAIESALGLAILVRYYQNFETIELN